MTHEGFSSKVMKIRVGETIRLVNDSRWVHIVGPGKDGKLADAKNVPMTGSHLMETNDAYVTGKWTTPGTYYLACSVHPEMTLKVIVTR